MSLETFTLHRIESSDQGTVGILFYRDYWLFTMELPQRDNLRGISCIPSGEYRVDWTYSNTFGREMYLLRDVPGRSGIRIHKGNWAGDRTLGYRSDVSGCILLGSDYDRGGQQHMLKNSTRAVNVFEHSLQKNSFMLRVIDPGRI